MSKTLRHLSVAFMGAACWNGPMLGYWRAGFWWLLAGHVVFMVAVMWDMVARFNRESVDVT